MNKNDCAGTAQSVGCTVEKANPHALIERINSGEVEIPEVSANKSILTKVIFQYCRDQQY